ncbi:MAG: nucleotidyltransferase domain-containing protein, partial [Elusimicrobiota bacterium]
EKLKPISSKIILFGSSCRGENTSDSDIDLLIISHNKDKIKEFISKMKSKRKIQAVIRTELNFSEMKQTNSDFYDQVNKVLFYGKKQMNPEFEKCLEHGKIKEFSEGKFLAKKEIKTAEKNLEDGREGFSRKKYKWATIQGD